MHQLSFKKLLKKTDCLPIITFISSYSSFQLDIRLNETLSSPENGEEASKEL